MTGEQLRLAAGEGAFGLRRRRGEDLGARSVGALPETTPARDDGDDDHGALLPAVGLAVPAHDDGDARGVLVPAHGRAAGGVVGRGVRRDAQHQVQTVGAFRPMLLDLWRLEGHVQAGVRGQRHGVDQHLVRRGDEGDVLAVGRAHAMQGGPEIQLARPRSGTRHLDDEIADGLVRLAPARPEGRQHLLGLHLPPGAEQSQSFGAGRRGGLRVGASVGVHARHARPQRRLIEPEAGAGRVAPGHGAEATVAEREGIEPVGGGSLTGDQGRHRVLSIQEPGRSNTGCSAARAAPCSAGSARASARSIATGPASAARAWRSTVSCTTGVISSAIGAR